MFYSCVNFKIDSPFCTYSVYEPLTRTWSVQGNLYIPGRNGLSTRDDPDIATTSHQQSVGSSLTVTKLLN